MTSTADQLRAHALAKPGAWRDDPWGEGHDVAKVGDKIFAFLRPDCLGVTHGSREAADVWLDEYPEDASRMAYIGRHGWNDLRLDGAIGTEELLEALDRSYDLVVARLPRRQRPPQEGDAR